MTPQLGDTIINRYSLVASLRNEAGLQAWRAHDSVLARECQLFFVTDGAVASQCSTLASGIALSRNRHFTPIYHFSESSGVALIITALDAGISLSDYLAGPTVGTLSNEAMRTIVGEIAEALLTLKNADLTNPSICTDTIRLSSTGVTVADAPVSTMLINPLGTGNSRAVSEEMVTKQLSAVLYAMLTRTPDVKGMDFDEQTLPPDVPEEFRIICTRALGLASADGSPSVPLRTLAEFEALLGVWTPPEELSDADISWPDHEGACSIEKVDIRPTDSHAVRDVPASFASEAKKTEAAEPQWATNQLLFPESNEVQIVRPTAKDGDLFAAFEDFPYINPVGSSYPENETSAIDVSRLRAAKAVDSGELSTNTGEMPATTAAVPVAALNERIAKEKEKQEEAEEQQEALNQEMTATMQPLPPSFTPKPRPHQATSDAYRNNESLYDDEDEENEEKSGKLFGLFTGRSLAILIGVVLLVAAMAWAVNGLLGAATGSSTSDTSKSAWPEMTNVPFPGSTSADASASSSAASSSSHSATSSSTKASGAKVTHADKNASAAPSPSPTPTATQNTTAFATGTQTFLNQPAGLQGRGWYVHLTEPQQVTRLVISIRQSGGQGQIYANSTASSPNQGDPVAQFAFDASGTTTVTLSKPVSTQDLVVWVPLDTTPSGGLYFNSVQVF